MHLIMFPTTYVRMTILSVAILVTIFALTASPVKSQPVGIAYDVENIRDLYEILLRQQQEATAAANAAAAAAAAAAASTSRNGNVQSHSPSMFVHQMERKGGRSPTLRLRFGRRADPFWGRNGPLTHEPSAQSPIDEQ